MCLVCTCVVSVEVAGLIGFFSIRVGQSSPPVVKRTPLRGLESETAQSAGWGISSLACVCDLIFDRKYKREKIFILWFLGKC